MTPLFGMKNLITILFLFLRAVNATTTAIRKTQQSSSAWPHHLTLRLTFDSKPDEVSWKFENQRSQKVLAGVPFGTYTEDEWAGKVVEVPLNILTNEDYDGDTTATDMMRDYRFVIYDQGGNGLCCDNGNGRYEIYSQDTLVAQNFMFGALDEQFLSINPRDFLDGNSGSSSTNTANVDNTGNPVVNDPDDDSGGSVVDYTAISDEEGNNNNVPNPTPSTRSPIPTQTPTTLAQITVDANKWFCGVNWDWVTNNCEKATPCPSGDRIDCPTGQECFASTPCTLVPTSLPSSYPSEMPTLSPTPAPSKSPWSEEAFLEFINSASDTTTNDGQTSGSSTTGGNNNDQVKSEVLDALQDFSSLQYHFFCGLNWAHADTTCGVQQFCPSGDRKDCPDGYECFAHTHCDGRDTPPPAPAGSNNNNDASSSDDDNDRVCNICERQDTLQAGTTIDFQNQATNCGSLDQLLVNENIQVSSPTCNSVRDIYQNTCCVEKCQLCSDGGPNSDLAKDLLIRQGGYEATCGEINDILSTSAKTSTICKDSTAQMGPECCYEQCSLCDDKSDTEWYATVQFQGLTTTCLGMDYLLRAEYIAAGSNRCSTLQDQYTNTCCTAQDTTSSGTGSMSSLSSSSESTCQLCMADNKLYDLVNGKVVSIAGQSSTTTCQALNDSLEANFEEGDKECTQGKQSFFGQCCNLSNIIVFNTTKPAGGGQTSGGSSSAVPGSSPTPGAVPGQAPISATTGTDGGTRSPSGPSFWDQPPTTGGNFTWLPNSGSVLSWGLLMAYQFVVVLLFV